MRTLVPVLLLVAVAAGALAMWSDTLKMNATIENRRYTEGFRG